MNFVARYPSRLMLQRGFSLIELSLVVAIISIVAVLGLEAASNFVVRNLTELSRERLVVADDAVANFFRVYGRLPCPAVRGGSDGVPEDTDYGLENCSGVTAITTPDIGGGLLIGALPFRTLNLPMSLSLDGFNSKLNYVVTKNLTVAGGSTTVSGRFASSGFSNALNGMAGIEVRSGVLSDTCTGNCQIVANPGDATTPGAAYFIFSSGADKRGAVSNRGASLNTCTTTTANSDARTDSQNCVFGDNAIRVNMTESSIPYNVFYDNRYNPGLNPTSYFDDVTIWRTKDKL